MLNARLNNDESRRLLKAVDTMREILHHEKITLPHIVVVGDQSVGKSSVLEALSGIQLPRAQNICTRCPLELRMKTILEDAAEYATIRCQGVPEIRINNFADIAARVTDCTNTLAGTNCGVSSLPIYLTVFKHDIREDLTLIDLPGITRNPVGGQAQDIYQQIVALIKRYIEPQTAIILHVIPASVDFTTSESIQLAKQHDPNGERQIIAVSKIDKFDRGIGQKLQGLGTGAMALKLGCIAVLNRTQEEIEQNVPFNDMRTREADFFRATAAFTGVPEQHLGTEQLVKQLAQIQQERIRFTLPAIIEELTREIRAKKAELKQIPEAMDSELDCWSAYNNLVRKYRDTISARVQGNYENDLDVTTTDTAVTTAHRARPPAPPPSTQDPPEDHIAVQIHQRQKKYSEQFHQLFSDFFKPEYRAIVLQRLEENAGVTLPNFPPFSIIERLYLREHKKFAPPCEELIESCSDYCKEILIKLLNQIFTTERAAYRHIMLPKMTEIVLGAVRASEEKCATDMKRILSMEQRIFTINPNYMETVNQIKLKVKDFGDKIKTNDGKHALPTFSVNDVNVNITGHSNEYQAALDVQVAMASYCRLVEKRLVDQVSQLCYYYFITEGALVLDKKLSTSFTSAMLFEWMREPNDQQRERERLKASIDAMERALAIGRTV